MTADVKRISDGSVHVTLRNITVAIKLVDDAVDVIAFDHTTRQARDSFREGMTIPFVEDEMRGRLRDADWLAGRCLRAAVKTERFKPNPDEKFLTDMLDKGATVIDQSGVHIGVGNKPDDDALNPKSMGFDPVEWLHYFDLYPPTDKEIAAFMDAIPEGWGTRADIGRHGEYATPRAVEDMPDNFFRGLVDDDEQETFRQWAREHYTAGDAVSGCWHPVVRAECQKINAEATDGK